MKTEKNILFAFVLNLFFSIFEFLGGIFTGSVAIISDAIHDIGDASSIGIAFSLEKKSRRQPDEKYTYGYARYSVIGGVITALILAVGSVFVIYNAVRRLIAPKEIDYNGMLVFAIVGVCVNLSAALLTRKGDSINQKAVNLHMLEDVLGWIVVLIGAIVMKFTDISIIDPLMSIGVAVFIFINAVKTLGEVIDLLLEKTPHGVNIGELRQNISEIDGVLDVHHIHVWSMDGHSNYATMHIVTNGVSRDIKCRVREKLKEQGIIHATLELEAEGEDCHNKCCRVEPLASHYHSHHHSHHHSHRG